MNYSEEFIELVAHPEIQKLIEPEVGMNYVKEGDSYHYLIIGDGEVREIRLNRTPYILLPSLELLVNLLQANHASIQVFNNAMTVRRYDDNWSALMSTMWTPNGTIVWETLGDDYKFTCLKALSKILGIIGVE